MKCGKMSIKSVLHRDSRKRSYFRGGGGRQTSRIRSQTLRDSSSRGPTLRVSKSEVHNRTRSISNTRRSFPRSTLEEECGEAVRVPHFLRTEVHPKRQKETIGATSFLAWKQVLSLNSRDLITVTAEGQSMTAGTAEFTKTIFFRTRVCTHGI